MKALLPTLVLALCALPLAASAQNLNKPFTLTYRVEIRDMRSKALIESAIAQTAKNYQPAIEKGTMTREQVADILEGMRQKAARRPPEHQTVTLSYDGDTLLVTRTTSQDKDPDPKTLQFSLLTKEGAFVRLSADSCQLVRHITILGLENVPVVGPSLPFLPLERDRKLLTMGGYAPDGLVYSGGKVDREISMGTPKITRILYGIGNAVFEDYKYTAHTQVSGQWVGKDIVYTKYNYGKDKLLDGAPILQTEYTLVDAQPQALPADNFQLQHYLTDGESVNVTKPKGDQIVINFDHRGGTIDQQAKEAELAYSIAVSRSRRSSTLAIPAGLAVGLLLIGGAYERLKKRPRQPALGMEK